MPAASASNHGPVVAIAGRRIDAPDAPARFPLENARTVAEAIRAFLVAHAATGVVASAACGADLIALEEAGALDLERRVVLPFPARRFRETSVTDRPGDWGPRFDRTLRDVGAERVRVLDDAGTESDDAAAYAAVNDVLLEEAVRLAGDHAAAPAASRPVLALLVWEGAPRGDGDLTADFRDRARQRGIPVAEVLTRP
jgi:hypothetical protein